MKHKNIFSIITIISSFLLMGCVEQKLSPEEIEDIKVEIRTLISEQGEAYETGNIEYYKHAASFDIMGFGTTKEIVFTNLEEWVEELKIDFQSMASIPYSIRFLEEPTHLSIQVSETGDMATAIYEAQSELSFEGEKFSRLFRMATTWRKENGEWKIVQWLGARPVE